jgi:hypothetical protein
MFLPRRGYGFAADRNGIWPWRGQRVKDMAMSRAFLLPAFTIPTMPPIHIIEEKVR